MKKNKSGGESHCTWVMVGLGEKGVPRSFLVYKYPSMFVYLQKYPNLNFKITNLINLLLWQHFF